MFEALFCLFTARLRSRPAPLESDKDKRSNLREEMIDFFTCLRKEKKNVQAV